MFTAYTIAFLMSVIIFGLPSKRNFDDLEGNHLIWNSTWFWGSILIHGLAAVLVVLLLFKLNMTISFGGKELSFKENAWVYGIFVGIFYPGVLYALIGGLSAVGLTIPEEDKNVKSSMDFYVSVIGRFIREDIYKLSRKIAKKTTTEIVQIENTRIEHFLTALFIEFDTEDAGKAAEIISEMRIKLETLGYSEKEAVDEIMKEASIEKILSGYLLKYGAKRYYIDIAGLKNTIKTINGKSGAKHG